MVDAVRRAAQAAVVRLGPLRPPWQWAVLLSAGGILAQLDYGTRVDRGGRTSSNAPYDECRHA